MSNKSDRVDRWGKLLAELADDVREFEQDKQDKLLATKKKYCQFYKTLEFEALSFTPDKLKQELSLSLKQDLSKVITLFSFTCDLTKKEDYRDFILEAFKTKAFFLKPFKILLRMLVEAIIYPIFWGLVGFPTAFLLMIKGVDNSLWGFIWQWLAWTGIILVLLPVVLNFLYWVFNSIFSADKESFITILEKDLKQDFTKEILISDRRKIKLPELRLLVWELEKFNLQPSLVIKRETNLRVRFELQIKTSSDFRQLL